MTVEQYRRHRKDLYLPPNTSSRDLQFFIGGVNFYDAARYCNWLSAEEGIPQNQQCYEINGETVSFKAGYLSLSGYRLPTEAEMEYGIRSGTVTSRCYGETEDLLTKYAWYQKNSPEQASPVGLLKPNDFGLFDVHGNANTWCSDRWQDYPMSVGGGVVEDRENSLTVQLADRRALRGGCHIYGQAGIRSAFRGNSLPSHYYNIVGLRLARTMLPDRREKVEPRSAADSNRD